MKEKPQKQKHKHIGFNLSNELYEQLTDFCEGRCASVSKVMRIALEMYLEDMKNVKPLTRRS